MRWSLLLAFLLTGCATTPGQTMNYGDQQAAAAILLGLTGAAIQANQQAQQQKQINAYNQALIQQQQAAARILNSYADQVQQQNRQ